MIYLSPPWLLHCCQALRFFRSSAFQGNAVRSQILAGHNKRYCTMSDAACENSSLFKGTLDRYNGVTVNSTQEHCDPTSFTQKLEESLAAWQEQKKRGIWFRVALEHAEWVPILAKHGFWFHHARPEHVTMCRWLPDAAVEPCNIPGYSHTMLGVGGLVTDSQGRILTVKERFWVLPMWKLPGGYIESGEDIADAAVREVFEETGVRTRFNSIVGFRHSHASQFGCSDIYLVAHLSPVDDEQSITKCDREINECCWMKLEEYVQHPEVHDMNRLVVRKFVENCTRGVSMPPQQLAHPVHRHRTVTVFTLDHPRGDASTSLD